MRRDLWITALAAAASAALYLSLTLGVLGAPFLAYFVQLPLLFIGLSLGLASASLAGLGSLGIVILFGGSIAALVFLVVQLGPSLLTIRQALLNRQADEGRVEWYPPGLILGHLVLYAGVVMVLVLLWVWSATGSIETAFLAAIAQVSAQLAGNDGPAMAIGQQIADYAAIVPGVVAVSWVLMTVVNAAIAQLLALRGGQARRPSFVFAELWLPAWCGPVLAVAVMASLVAAGDLAFFAQGLAVLFAVPYLMQGLAVIHAAVARLPAKRLALAGFYLVLLLFSWPLVVGVVLLGLLEDWAQFRRRLA